MTARTRTILTNLIVLALALVPFGGAIFTDAGSQSDFTYAAAPSLVADVNFNEESFFMPETSELDPEPVQELEVNVQPPTPPKSSYPEGVESGIRALLPPEEQAQDLTPVLEADNTTTTSNYGASSVTYTIGSPMFFTGSAMNSPGSPSVDAFGHGLGFSQWGAYGAAKNAGWNANQIVTHYYRDTNVAPGAPRTVNVVGYGVMDMEVYLAGLGEVPSRACGTQADKDNWTAYANSQGWAANDPRRDKFYTSPNPGVWDCWPEESIKAQLIVARSFAAYQQQSQNGQPICTTASCQIYYHGSTAKAWAAWQTKDQYIYSSGYTHNGQIINALFSSYISNGVGTADHAIATNAWYLSSSPPDYSGTTSSYSYLRSVPDASFTHVHIGRSATVNSTAYRIDELDAMIDWCSTTCQAGAWLQTNVNSRIGTLTSIEFTSDDSGRVMLVRYIGTDGTATTSGAFFRSVYNTWVDVVRPHGVADKIPSISFKATATFMPTAEQLPAVNAAKADVLARNPGADPNVIFPQALSASDYGCLGTQATGFCATATTPGYKLIMSYANQAWEYRVRDDYSGLVFVGVISQ